MIDILCITGKDMRDGFYIKCKYMPSLYEFLIIDDIVFQIIGKYYKNINSKDGECEFKEPILLVQEIRENYNLLN